MTLRSLATVRRDTLRMCRLWRQRMRRAYTDRGKLECRRQLKSWQLHGRAMRQMITRANP